MGRPTAIILTSCCLLGGVWAMASQQPPSEESSELNVLKRRVETLEQLVTVLNDRMHMLEERQKVVPRAVPSPRIPSYPPAWQVPEGWRWFEFNGRPVYVMPLAGDPNAAGPKK